MKLFGPSKLTSALIARKGHAVPSGYGFGSRSQPAPASVGANSGSESCSQPQSPATAGAEAPVAEGAVNKAPRRRTVAVFGAAERSRVSLRLDDERHLRLKLTASHMQTTLQDILTQALDTYLDQISPEVIRDNCLCLGSDDPPKK